MNEYAFDRRLTSTENLQATYSATASCHRIGLPASGVGLELLVLCSLSLALVGRPGSGIYSQGDLIRENFGFVLSAGRAQHIDLEPKKEKKKRINLDSSS